MDKPSATPEDSRYIPLTQQAACCVPTCLQMIMYKNDVPLMPAEELGYHLGLTVHPSRKHLFYNVRTAETPPPAGYGTQIYNPDYEPNKVFREIGVPLSLTILPSDELGGPDGLLEKLRSVEVENADAMLCFNHGALVDNPDMDWGHLCVFDRIIDGQIRIVDPSPEQPKWRLVTAEKLFAAMEKHGVKNSASVWLIKKT